MKRDLKHLLQTSGLTFILRIGGMGLGYLVAILISNLYGAEVYGRYSIMVTFSLFAVMLFSLGIPTAIVKLTASPKFYSYGQAQSNYLIKSFFILLFSSLLGALLLFLLKGFFAENIFHDELLKKYFLYLSVLFPFLIIHGFLIDYYRGSQQFIKYGLFTFIFPAALLLLLLSIFRSNNDFTESIVFLSYLLGFMLTVLIALIYFPIKINRNFEYSSKNLMRLSLPMLFSSTFIFLTNWTDIFMLGVLVPKEDVGIYNAAWKIATLTVIVINVVNIIIGPQIAKLFETKDLAGLKKKVQQATQLITLLTLPIIILIILFRKPLLQLFGTDYLDGEMTLIILSIGMFFNALSGSVSLVLNMTNKQIALRNFTIIAAITNIVLNYFLINSMGILGAALATTITTILLNTMGITCIKRTFNFYPFSFKLRRS